MGTIRKIAIVFIAICLWLLVAFMGLVMVFAVQDVFSDKTPSATTHTRVEQVSAQNIQLVKTLPEDAAFYPDCHFYQLDMDVTNTGNKPLSVYEYSFDVETADGETRMYARTDDANGQFKLRKEIPVSCTAHVSFCLYSYEDASGKELNLILSSYPDDQLVATITAP